MQIIDKDTNKVEINNKKCIASGKTILNSKIVVLFEVFFLFVCLQVKQTACNKTVIYSKKRKKKR